MILLSDLFSLLSDGEFSQTPLKRKSTGGLDESEYTKVVGFVNRASLEIHKRLQLLEQEIKLHAKPSVENYYLRAQYVTQESLITSLKYLEQPDDWNGCINMIRVLEVLDEDGGTLSLNNRHCTPYVRLQGMDHLKITGITSEQTLTVVYQGYPAPIIVDDDFDTIEYQINIQPVFIEALLFYIAACLYKPTGTNDSTANSDKSNDYLNQFELEIQRVKRDGLYLSDDDVRDKFEEEGWV